MTDESKPIVDWRNDPNLSDTWKFRFDFYDRYGMRGWVHVSDEYKTAFMKLGLADRLKVNINLWAFFFGVIYLFILGLWRQAILVFACSIGLVVVLTLLSLVLPGTLVTSLTSGLGLAFGAFFAMRTNAWYYYEKTKGGVGWTL